MKVSVYSAFADRVTGVFDRSRTGERIGAERWDEPGEENFALCDEYDVPDPMADLLGDWSWKPHRYKQDPGRVFTADQIRQAHPEGYLNFRVANPSTDSGNNIDPETGREVRNLHKSLL